MTNPSKGTLLVTGVAGFIGSQFARTAQQAGYAVVGLDRMTYAGRARNLPNDVYAEKICITDYQNVLHALLRYHPVAIVHLAAETHVARSIESREEFLRTNVIGTNVLLEATVDAIKASVLSSQTLFLHVSTDEVYGSLGKDDPYWTECSPYRPLNPYSASKAASDHLVQAYANTFGLRTIVAHSANNYGPRQHPEKLIPTLVRQVMNGEPMTLHGDGRHSRDWLHVEDHCRGLLLALEKGVPSHTYNFGGGCERDNVTIASLVDEAINGDREPWPIEFIKDRPGNDRRYAMGNAKALRELGWEPHYAIEDRIIDTVQWYLDNPRYGEEYGR